MRRLWRWCQHHFDMILPLIGAHLYSLRTRSSCSTVAVMSQRPDTFSLPALERLYRTFVAVQTDFATALLRWCFGISPA